MLLIGLFSVLFSNKQVITIETPFQVKEEEENAMHNTVVIFSSNDNFTLKQVSVYLILMSVTVVLNFESLLFILFIYVFTKMAHNNAVLKEHPLEIIHSCADAASC